LEAAHRRLGEEMGIDAALTEEFTFIYKQKFGNGLTEHELDHVVFGSFNDAPVPNPDEVADWKYISIDALQKDIEANPDQYTIWLKIALAQVIEHLNK
jgi:isopentenyl-diphosphate delta-isomerase